MLFVAQRAIGVDNLSVFSTDVSDIQAKIDQDKARFKDLDFQIVSLQAKLSDLQNQKKSLVTDIASLDAQINDRKQRFEDFKRFKIALFEIADRTRSDVSKLEEWLKQTKNRDIQSLYEVARAVDIKVAELLKDKVEIAYDKNKQELDNLLADLQKVRIFKPSVVQNDATVTQKEAPLSSSVNDLSALSKELESVLIPLRNK